MIPDPLAIGAIVAAAAVLTSHLSVRAFLVLLAAFAVLWVAASRNMTGEGPGGLALVLVFFIIAAGLAVAAGVQLIRVFFRDRALSRLQITLAALVGSAAATGFLVLLFWR